MDVISKICATVSVFALCVIITVVTIIFYVQFALFVTWVCGASTMYLMLWLWENDNNEV